MTIEVIFAVRTNFKALDMFPQEEKTRTFFAIGAILKLKKCEEFF